MTIESELFTHLKTSVGASVGGGASPRIHYFKAPQTETGKAPPVPFIVYTDVEREYLDDLGGTTDYTITTFQIDVCATTFLAAKAIAQEIHDAMLAWAEPIGVFHEDYGVTLDENVEPALARVIQTWVVHHQG